MRNLQVRLDEVDLKSLDELSKDLRRSRSDVARTALREGVKRIRLERALTRYLSHEFTLTRAAEYAGVGIYEMSQVAADRGIPLFRYSVEELERDAERAETTQG
jgi:predicted HTH domain antitoxin